MVGTHRSPAVGNAVRAVTGFDRFRCGGAAVYAAEGIPLVSKLVTGALAQNTA